MYANPLYICLTNIFFGLQCLYALKSFSLLKFTSFSLFQLWDRGLGHSFCIFIIFSLKI